MPFKSLLPMVAPEDLIIGGWDISGLNLAESMERAKVLDWGLQQQLVPLMRDMQPLPGAHPTAGICSLNLQARSLLASPLEGANVLARGPQQHVLH